MTIKIIHVYKFNELKHIKEYLIGLVIGVITASVIMLWWNNTPPPEKGTPKFKLGQSIIIPALKKPATITRISSHKGEPVEYEVHYQNNSGEFKTDWVLEIELTGNKK